MDAFADNQAVAALYRRHHGALRRFLTRMLRCEDSAADVAQETYLRLLRLGPRRKVADPRAYLFQVAANAARDRLARERTRERVVDAAPPDETVACQRPGPETEAANGERLRILAEAVDGLSPRCREVFLMSRVEGLANAEIARRLGISRNMVEKHIIKAMLRCRQRLEAAGL